MEIVFTIHNPGGQSAPRKIRRSGNAAHQIISTIEHTIGGSAKVWIGRYNPTLGITIHHLFS